MTEPSFTVPASAFQALMSAVNSYITNSANARAALAILPSLDAQFIAAWVSFDKALAPVAQPTENAPQATTAAPAPAPDVAPTNLA